MLNGRLIKEEIVDESEDGGEESASSSGISICAFPRHVHEIYVNGEKISIKTLPDSDWFHLDGCMDVVRHLSSVKNIRSCGRLFFRVSDGFNGVHATILKDLRSSNELALFDNSDESLEKFFANARFSVRSRAWLELDFDDFRENQSMKELLENFIETQLIECCSLNFSCYSDEFFFFDVNILAKMQTEFLSIYTNRDDVLEMIVRWVYFHGIPNKHCKPAIHVRVSHSRGVKENFVDFFSQYRGMERIEGKNHSSLIAMSNDIMGKHGEDQCFKPKCLCVQCPTLCFRRNVDANKDCVYILDTQICVEFMAFYVPRQLNE